MTMNSSPAILSRFHELIRSVAGKFVDNPDIQMPLLPEVFGDECYFPVPGMYGGFKYWLEPLGDGQKLVVTSWSRVVEDSKQTFEISVDQTIRLCDDT